MAVLATPDWQFNTRDGTMDIPTNSRQPTSPTNDSGSLQHHGQQQQSQHQTQQQQQQQQQQFQQQQHLLQQQQMLLAAQQSAFTYPVQQQPHGSWTPSITAAPFYPSFFQNSQQQQQQPPQPYPAQIPPQNSYFDSTNAQLAAQWAYQQMMFNAQHVFPQMQPQHHSSTHRPSNPNQQGQPPNSNDFFAQNSLFNPFPSGTPPPHPHRSVSGDQTQQYPGFHPYRRPNRQQAQPHSSSDSASDRRQGINHIPHPPYARPDASGSSSSVSSSGSRKRTNSNQSVQSNGHSNRRPSPVSAGGGQSSTRNLPSSTGGGGPALSPSTQPAAPSPLRQQPHHRNSSTSSTSTATSIRPGTLSPSPPTSSISTTSAIASTTTASSSGSTTPRLTRPSPLSQGTFTASEKRMSRDDIDLGALQDAAQSASSRSGGLKGRLRRALSFNPAQVLKEEGPLDDNDDVSIKASQVNNKVKDKPTTSNASSSKANGLENGSANAIDSGVEDGSSTRAPTQVKKKSRAASLFNARMNMSTDNISLSSTVSSASVMIRKLGAMGKLARRNSLAGITSLFKDKDKDGPKDKKGKKKDKKASPKAEASEASVSHVTAELDRMGGDWTVNSAELQGLTPAAKLARQHTLKSNAEAAARAKEAAAAAAAARESASTATTSSGLSGANKEVDGNVVGNGSVAGVATWDRNTATRQGSVSPVKGALLNMRVNEDGTRTLIEEDDDDESDEGHYGHPGGSFSGLQHGSDGWDDDEDWDVDGDGDEDVTIRADARNSVEDDHGFGRASAEMEPWAVDIRRSIEKTKSPARGILRNALSYDQNRYLQHDHVTILNRGRSNSYTSTIVNSEVGPLARMPSPDPDHIDGLRHNTAPRTSSSSSPAETPQFTLPPLSFESSSSPLNATFDLTTSKDLPKPPSNFSSISSPIITHTSSTHSEHRTSAIYQNVTFNSSAPALSTMGSSSTRSPPTLTHRSHTAPLKQLTFATNLSVYDTFSSNVYDRRSEPATWSRLTPVLAQRIKEELNSYKMEEMEVHAASRIHTQFFV